MKRFDCLKTYAKFILDTETYLFIKEVETLLRTTKEINKGILGN
jgi:hypothetical protein